MGSTRGKIKKRNKKLTIFVLTFVALLFLIGFLFYFTLKFLTVSPTNPIEPSPSAVVELDKTKQIHIVNSLDKTTDSSTENSPAPTTKENLVKERIQTHLKESLYDATDITEELYAGMTKKQVDAALSEITQTTIKDVQKKVAVVDDGPPQIRYALGLKESYNLKGENDVPDTDALLDHAVSSLLYITYDAAETLVDYTIYYTEGDDLYITSYTAENGIEEMLYPTY